jgi:hypothetical protein
VTEVLLVLAILQIVEIVLRIYERWHDGGAK